MMTQSVCRSCDHGIVEHPRYFPRQLVTAADLTLEQRYVRDKMRRHNRYLHGWGVECGALVCLVLDKQNNCAPMSWRVQVSPGYILGPAGDEILIDCHRIVDLQTHGLVAKACDPPGAIVDPWCTPVKAGRKPGDTLYIAIRYVELEDRPVRAQPAGCGCNDSDCEMSRWVDGYEIGVLTELPQSHQNWNPPINDLFPPNPDATLIPGPLPECPECSQDGWVVLARVVIDVNGVVVGIDNLTHRRMGVSLARAWWRANAAGPDSILQVKEVSPAYVTWSDDATITTDIELTGTGFTADSRVLFDDPGVVVVSPITVGGTAPDLTLTLSINISRATRGAKTVVVVNPDCSSAALSGKLIIDDAARSKRNA